MANLSANTYNFLNLCKAFTFSLTEAKKIFHAQSSFLTSSSSLRDFRSFLNAMNLGIYNYFLFKYDISIHTWTHKNSIVMHKVHSLEDFYKAGEEILDCYYQFKKIFFSETKNPLVLKALKFIDDNYLDKNCSLESCSDCIAVSKCHLSVLFKKHLNSGFTDYVNQLRINHAQMLLLKSNLSISEVGFESGFNSNSYFTLIFTKFTSINPSSYRSKVITN